MSIFQYKQLFRVPKICEFSTVETLMPICYNIYY